MPRDLLGAPSSYMTPSTSRLLARLGAGAHRRRGRVVLAWVVAILAVAGLVATFGDAYSTQYSLPDVESADGFALLEERFGSEEGGRVGTIAPVRNQRLTTRRGRAATRSK